MELRWINEGKPAVKTKAECFKACITISFEYALLTKREVFNMTACYYMVKFFFCILLDFLKFLNIFRR